MADSETRLAGVCLDRADGSGWEWLDLPVSDSELESFLHDRLGIDARLDEQGRLPAGVECRISDFDREGLLKTLGFNDLEHESITDVNLMCRAFQYQARVYGDGSLDPVVERVWALLAFDHPGDEPSAYEVANYAMQLGGIPYSRYGLVPEQERLCGSPDEKYGLEVISASGLTAALDTKLAESDLMLSGYVDVERLGSECAMNDNVETLESGYYMKNLEPDVDPGRYSRAELRGLLDDRSRQRDAPTPDRGMDLPEYWRESFEREDYPLAREVLAHDGSLLDLDTMMAIARVLGSCDWDFYEYADGEYSGDLLELCESTPIEASQELGYLHDCYLAARESHAACDPADPTNLAGAATTGDPATR
ncbi:antirestriction protein ArdA [Bifidobacterium saguini DSM 23967]|uniref:Antirestriction protein ArdA n=2 Tax=Bifidobacterium saguini TaxID=762210 RepID=A0A087D5P2_9BIFI|nr:antirestriction protein ArdA [Bifidobacterium saguini]KFI90842.1 antirestriction protein ArdA [Bifidobacterium saguini DSM 23967]QTB90743.1 antirestriction protein ArdA [Bifidobacterium saguini]